MKREKSSVKTEVIGGVTTFLAMAYIIFVNPAILSLAGMDKGALITVTCLATAIGTFLAAFNLGNGGLLICGIMKNDLNTLLK